MINHVSIGVSDIARAKSFYDAALKPLGYSCLSAGDTSLGYGKDAVALWVTLTRSPVKADPTSGLHFCFDGPTRKSVETFHVTTAFAPTTARITTRPSSSTPMAIGSRLTAADRHSPVGSETTSTEKELKSRPLPCGIGKQLTRNNADATRG